MMRKIRTSALVFMMLALLIAPLSLSPLTAGASEAEGQAVQTQVGGEAVPFDTLIYKVMQTHNQWIVIIGGTLDESVPLPATVEVAVPAGSPVFWFGEVGGSGDPALDPRFPGDLSQMRRTEGDLDIYTAVMTTYHNMQIEYRLNHNPFSQGPDGPTIALEYTPLQDVRELRLAAALPPGGAVLARDIDFLGNSPVDPNDPSAERSPAFARIFPDAQGGQLYSTEITYTITGGGSAASNLPDVVIYGLVVAAVVAAAVIFLLFAKGMRRTDHDEDYYYENYAGDEDEEDEEYDHEDDDDDSNESSFVKRH